MASISLSKWNWRMWWSILVPLIFLPLAIQESKQLRCLYMIILMASFWLVEAIPLAITALFPVALLPILGIEDTAHVVTNYMTESGMMFFGGISLALGIEHSGLHKRIALKTMLLIGTSYWRLLLGVMVTVFMLSCWVSNTSVTAMMIPIVQGLVESFDVNEKDRSRLRILFFLAAGYSANIGGTTVMIGSITNLVFRNLIELEDIGQGGKYTDLNFVTWITFAFPVAVINLFIMWGVLGFLYIGRKGINADAESSHGEGEKANSDVKTTLRKNLRELGKPSFHETAVAVIFFVAILLWFTRDPKIFPGWGTQMPKAVADASVAVFLVIVMFIVPKDPWNRDPTKRETLMNWECLQTQFPWGVILLVGGGFAISDAAQKTGLSSVIGDKLSSLEVLPPQLILLIVLFVVSLLTEVTANAAAVSLLTPILLALSRRLNLHPLYITFAGAIGSQFAFIMPTSNPPNAMVFSKGNMRVIDMVKSGAILNVLCVTVLFLMNLSWGEVVFKWSNYEYADMGNSSSSRI